MWVERDAGASAEMRHPLFTTISRRKCSKPHPQLYVYSMPLFTTIFISIEIEILLSHINIILAGVLWMGEVAPHPVVWVFFNVKMYCDDYKYQELQN